MKPWPASCMPSKTNKLALADTPTGHWVTQLRHPSHPPLLPETARRHDLIDLHGLAKRLPPVLAVPQLAHRVNHTRSLVAPPYPFAIRPHSPAQYHPLAHPRLR